MSPPRARLSDIRHRQTTRCRQAHCPALARRRRRARPFASSRPSHLLAPFEAWLEARWASGSRVGQQLWRELQQQGYTGSRVTIARWAANRRKREAPEGAAQPPPTWKAPTRRRCAWYLSQNLDQIDAETKLFLGHLFAQAPELATAAELAKRFVSLLPPAAATSPSSTSGSHKQPTASSRASPAASRATSTPSAQQ